jgi:hypothetical protein
MFSFQMMAEKLIKKWFWVPQQNKTLLLSGILVFTFSFFFFFIMECAGCLYNFVQMTAEPAKGVAVIDA